MPSLAAGVSCEHFDEGAVVLDSQRGEYLTVNSTASAILRLLSQGRSEEEILASLSAEFPEEDAGEIASQISIFLADLSGRGFLAGCRRGP